MSRPRFGPGGSAAAALAAVVALVTLHAMLLAPAATAHEHPTPVERDSPGVVYIETAALVEISLIEANPSAGGNIGLTQRTYQPVLSSGSGFAVDPSGFIVTSTETISPDKRPAEIFAVNQLFSEKYGAAAPLPANAYAQQVIGGGQDGPLNRRLQRCYRPNTIDASGGCVIRTTLRVTVYPYVTSQERYGALPAKRLSRNLPDSPVSVVKIGANSMPTVELAGSVSGAEALAVLGFTGVPGASNQLVKVNAHLDAKAGTAKAEDLAELPPALTAGLRGGPVVAEKGQVVGFFPWSVAAPGQPETEVTNPALPELVEADTIQSVLAAVGVTPKRGPTDLAFEDALHAFKNDEYAASIPSLRSTVKSYPGHFIATSNLEVAEARRGTAADLTGQVSRTAGQDDGSSTLAWIAGVVAGLAVLATLALLVLLRRRRHASLRSAPEAPPVPAGGSAAASIPAASIAAGRDLAVGTPAPRSSHDGEPVPAGGPPVASGRLGEGRRESAQRPASRVFVRAEPGPEPEGGPARSGRAASAAEEAHTYCTSCGQRLAPNHRFCGWCGHSIG